MISLHFNSLFSLHPEDDICGTFILFSICQLVSLVCNNMEKKNNGYLTRTHQAILQVTELSLCLICHSLLPEVLFFIVLT